jgi:hypothetical protein
MTDQELAAALKDAQSAIAQVSLALRARLRVRPVQMSDRAYDQTERAYDAADNVWKDLEYTAEQLDKLISGDDWYDDDDVNIGTDAD